MDKMKDPALLWCGANTVVSVGGILWLYQINVKLAAQVTNLTEIVNQLNEANKNNPLIFNGIDAAIKELGAGVNGIAHQLDQHHEYFNYLSTCNESMADEIKKSSSDYVLPRKPSSIKKLTTLIKKKGKKAKKEESEDESSASASSSSEEEEDPMVLLKKKRQAKAKAKKGGKT